MKEKNLQRIIDLLIDTLVATGQAVDINCVIAHVYTYEFGQRKGAYLLRFLFIDRAALNGISTAYYLYSHNVLQLSDRKALKIGSVRYLAKVHHSRYEQ